jgi:hypothetical protein
MSHLHITEESSSKEKTRHELYMEQLRLRDEYKKRNQDKLLQAQAFNTLKQQQQLKLDGQLKSRTIVPPAQQQLISRTITPPRQQLLDVQQKKAVQEIPLPQQQVMQSTTEKGESDDEVMVDEEMTNRNICIGMVNTDIVVEKSPLILIRDDQYEIVSLESEGKLNTDNYCKLSIHFILL